MTNAPPFSVRLTLPYSAVNAKGWAKAEWLVNAFQDIASQQHHDLGISGFHMASKGLKWMVAQYRIQVHTPISWLTPLTLATWRYPWKNLYETRVFEITGPDGKPLASATGIWVLVKADSGMPVRLNRHLPPELMDPSFMNQAHMNQTLGKDPRLVKHHPDLCPDSPHTPFRVMFHDLDMNQHVNNAVYVRWAVESLAQAAVDHLPVKIRISYLKECFYPETVHCHVSQALVDHSLLTDHAVIRPETGEVLARIAVTWQKPLAPPPLCWHG